MQKKIDILDIDIDIFVCFISHQLRLIFSTHHHHVDVGVLSTCAQYTIIRVAKNALGCPFRHSTSWAHMVISAPGTL